MKHWVDPFTVAILIKVAKGLILPAAGGGGWLTRKWLISRSSQWAATQGQVQGILPGQEQALCVVTYSYSVNGEYYSGEIPIFKNRVFRKQDDVRLALPVGSRIDVRYAPGKPARSVGFIPDMIRNGAFPLHSGV